MRLYIMRTAFLWMLVGLFSAALRQRRQPSARRARPCCHPGRRGTGGRRNSRLPWRPPAERLIAPPTQPGTPTSTEAVSETAESAKTSVPPAATPVPISVIASTQEPPAASCRVISAGLNLRPGPGTVYAPPLAALPRDAELHPISFVARGFPSGQWIEAQVISNSRVGWVSAGPQFVACNVQLASLPSRSAAAHPHAGADRHTLPAPQIAIIPVDGSDGNKDLGNNRGVNSGTQSATTGLCAKRSSHSDGIR